MAEQTGFIIGTDGEQFAPPIRPDEILDYPINLSTVLGDEIILSVSWSSTYITVDTDLSSFSDKGVVVWLKNGIAKKTASVTMDIVINGGTIQRTFYIKVVPK